MEKRIVPQLKGINDYYDQPYNEIYRSVVDIAKDVRRIDSNTSEGIEKCKWVAAMINMLFDIAMHPADHLCRCDVSGKYPLQCDGTAGADRVHGTLLPSV